MKIWFERVQIAYPNYSNEQVRAKMLHEMLQIDPTLYWVKTLPVFYTIEENKE